MVDTVQPQGLLGFRNWSASSLLTEDATAEMEQTQNQSRGTTPDKRLLWWEGLDVAETPHSGQGRCIFLDIPFYRPGLSTSLRRLFALAWGFWA